MRTFLAVIASFALVVAGCGGEPAPAAETTATTLATTTTMEPATTTTTTTASSTTSTTMVTTTTRAFATTHVGSLQPGTYGALRSPAPFVIDVPEGWEGLFETPADFAIGQGFFSDQSGSGFERSIFVVYTRAADAPATVADEFLAITDLGIERLADVTIADRDAIVLEGSSADSIELRVISDASRGFRYGTNGQSRFRFYVVDTGQGSLIVWVEAPLGEFDDFAAEAEAVLDTLEFIDA